jgi:glutamyl-tRNA synthetase
VQDDKAWRKVMKGDAARVLTEVEAALIGVPAGDEGPNGDGFTIESVQSVIEPLPEKLNLGPSKVFQPIRVAITGTTISPGIFESVAALGRDETLARIESAKLRLADASE